MYLKQHTIGAEVRFEGIGLHTGTPSTMLFRPAPENFGIRFKRTDLPNQPEIKAELENVVDLERSTTIAANQAKVHTIEHVLSALAGLQIDNVLIEIHGIEPPALDGSAAVYLKHLKQAGTVEQTANREFYVIDEPIHYHDPKHNIDLAALEYDNFRITVMVDYNSTILGIQHATLRHIDDFEQEIAPARTFCFWHELEYLLKAGLIKGGNLTNAIVIVNEDVPQAELDSMAKQFNLPALQVAKAGILNNASLHYPNEPARHKLLDLVGDLMLIGAPLKAQIVGIRPGHASNIAFARQIKSIIKQKQIIRRYQREGQGNVVFDVNSIQKILPHRYPFLLVDRITYFNQNMIEGIKNVTINEPFFAGHFAGNPIMPGVLILEAMAQVGGILMLNIVDDPAEHWVYFLAIDSARFKKPVVPGDQLVFKLEMINHKRNITRMHGRAYVEGTLVCEAELVASLVRKN